MHGAAEYGEILEQLAGLLGGERDPIANAANTAALLWRSVPRLNWVGFYLAAPDGGLVLGPFQGKPACTRIGAGRGVCGAAAARRQSVLVPDVHAFAGHISCDPASRAELVVPLLWGAEGRVLGVLDLDSPEPGRFEAEDQAGLERVAACYVAACAWPR